MDQHWDAEHKERERFVDVLLEKDDNPAKTIGELRSKCFKTYPHIKAFLYPERESRRKDSKTSISIFKSKKPRASRFERKYEI